MESSPQNIEPNVKYGFLIGCQQYTDSDLFAKEFPNPISKSHEDVDRYKEFLHQQEFHEVIALKDNNNPSAINMHKKITDLLKQIYDNSGLKGKNPWRVNFITYSGHGYTFNGDAIAVIPEYDNKKK